VAAFVARYTLARPFSPLCSTLEDTSLGSRIRQDFSILQRNVSSEKALVYLDSGATSQKPKVVVDALARYYTETNSNVHRGAHTLSREATTAYEAARDKVAAFIHAYHRNEVVFCSGATDALNLLAQTYGKRLQKDDEIILSVAEHHANLVPWQILAQEKELKLRFVPLADKENGVDVNHLESLLNAKTKIVSLQHVSNVLGCVNPIEEIVPLVRRLCPDAIVILDACQSVPNMSVDVQQLGVDFIVASGHKMMGPTGIGFLWGRESLLNQLPPYKGGGEMIDQVTLESSTWLPSPSRFEAGTPAIAQAIGLGVAIDYLQDIGMDKIHEYEKELGEYLYEQLSQVPGIRILGPPSQRTALCAFSHESVHPSDLSTFLDMDGVAIRAGHHCCQPLHHELGLSHSARASLYVYNTKE